jgi:hypothetical protein
MPENVMFRTSDSALVQWLVYRGHRASAVPDGSRTRFVFTESPELRRDVSDYHSGAHAPAAALIAAGKVVRQLIYQTRKASEAGR